MESFAEKQISKIKDFVEDNEFVICAISGGVDLGSSQESAGQ